MAMMVMAVRAWAHGKGRSPDESPLRPGYLSEHNEEGGIPPFALEGEPGFEAWLRFKQDKLVPLAEEQRSVQLEKKKRDGVGEFHPSAASSGSLMIANGEASQRAGAAAAELTAIGDGRGMAAGADGPKKRRVSHFIPAAFRRYVRDHALLGGPGEKGPPNECVKDAADSLRKHLESEYDTFPPEGITNMAMMVMAVRAWAHGRDHRPDELPLRPSYLFEYNEEGGVPPFALEGEPGFEAWSHFKQERLVPLAEEQRNVQLEKKERDGAAAAAEAQMSADEDVRSSKRKAAYRNAPRPKRHVVEAPAKVVTLSNTRSPLDFLCEAAAMETDPAAATAADAAGGSSCDDSDGSDAPSPA
eukprot:2849798-Prymnesium_polylepis.2